MDLVVLEAVAAIEGRDWNRLKPLFIILFRLLVLGPLLTVIADAIKHSGTKETNPPTNTPAS